MSDDYWNARNQGALGNARPVGGGPRAWQGYDQGRAERERQQQAANTASHTRTDSSYLSNTGASSTASTDVGDGGSDSVLDGIVLLIFMGLFTWAAVSINAHFEWAGRGLVILGSVVSSYFLGILIIRLLKILFFAIVGLSILGGLGYLGWNYIST